MPNPADTTADRGGAASPMPTVTTSGDKSADLWGWSLATSPLIMPAAAFALGCAGILALPTTLAIPVVAVQAAIVAVDRRRQGSEGPLPAGAMPSFWWFVLPCIYLWRRARTLGLRSRQGWAWIAVSILSYPLYVFAVAIGLGEIHGTTGQAATATLAADADPALPHCADRASMDDVIATFDDVEAVRGAGIHGVVLTDQAEVGQGPGDVPAERVCTGAMEASDTRTYEIVYGFEVIQGWVVVRVRLQ